MKTIKENINNTLIIKNSKFITQLYKINKKDEITDYLNKAKKDYPKATHYCYAYILDEIKNKSDDNEPSNTAGLPMLNVLEKENLNHILVITIRYFGGIKLGAGGLVRAYKKSVTECLSKTKTINMNKAKLIEITINYDMQKQLEYLLKEEKILNKEYKTNIKYNVIVDDKNLEKLKKYKYEIINNTYIEKE